MSASPLRIGLLNPVVDTGAIDTEPMLAPLRTADISIDMQFLDTGPTSIETHEDIAACLPGSLRAGAHLVERGAQAVVINCMCDPAVPELRARYWIPILGPAEASMHAIAAMGLKFSVLDVVSGGREMVEAQVHEHGVQKHYVSHRSIEMPVLKLYEDPAHTAALLEREALAAMSDGAQALLLGCTGLAELADNLSRSLRARDQRVVVVEPLRTTIELARNILQANRTSLDIHRIS